MLTINAEIRIDRGKCANRRLRISNKLPAIIYGSTSAPLSITIDHDVFLHLQSKKDFYNDTITLFINGRATIVGIKAIQRHPFKSKIMHIDFIRTPI